MGGTRGPGMSNVTRVFVAGPFWGLVDPRTGRMPIGERNRIERLIEHFESKGCEVSNAHKREAWGEEFLDPDIYTKVDFDEISKADVLVALPGNPVSPGTHVEIGWASALGKPIVLLVDPEKECAGLLRGLRTITNVEFVLVPEAAVDLGELDEAVERMLQPNYRGSGDVDIP